MIKSIKNNINNSKTLFKLYDLCIYNFLNHKINFYTSDVIKKFIKNNNYTDIINNMRNSSIECDIKLNNLYNNIISYGMFFPFANDSGYIRNGNHRLFSIYNAINSYNRKLSIIEYNNHIKDSFVLFVPNININYKANVDIYIYYDNENNIKNKILTIDSLCSIIKVNKEIYSLDLCFLIAEIISPLLFDYFKNKNLETISKSPVVNCPDYLKRYKHKLQKQILCKYNIKLEV